MSLPPSLPLSTPLKRVMLPPLIAAALPPLAEEFPLTATSVKARLPLTKTPPPRLSFRMEESVLAVVPVGSF